MISLLEGLSRKRSWKTAPIMIGCYNRLKSKFVTLGHFGHIIMTG